MTKTTNFAGLFILAVGALLGSSSLAQQIQLVERPPDPHGSPRPARDARDVPIKTSIYLELGTPAHANSGEVSPESVSVRLQEQGGEVVALLQSGRQFVKGAAGWLRPKQDLQGAKSLAVYIEPGRPLQPATKYTIVVSAGAVNQKDPSVTAGTWSFSTESVPAVHAQEFSLDLKSEPIHWQGRFFSGNCNVIFCTQAANYGPTFDLMAAARKEHSNAWTLQRDFWLTGTEFRPPGFFPVSLPNIVRERETRRISAIEPQAGSLVLRVEDVFGHEQYGIPSGRPVGDDFHEGDEVLIADGIHDARTKVLAADSAAGTVTVTSFATPPGGWKIDYAGPLPQREDPDAPGLFPPGGCYLRKFNPHGTACYYWGRLDKEWDLACRRYGRRVVANFADAPGDVARDGRSWTTVKDYPQWHEVARAIAGHIIDRYGADALNFTWSVFNEPDLGPMFWRADWNELQKFYDYTTDAILRAFEDRGFRSDKVFIGGLELGGIFGTHLKLKEFLAHCSPRALAEGAAPKNAAFADRKLDGKRSKRVESLCQKHAGKGTPCDFISIHSYNRSELMAAKLIRAKEMALEIDAEYYRALWVNSHEACPDWMPPPDVAAADAYLGNGYFETWCMDVVHRQVVQAARDPRFAFGETILTVWPPPSNFAGINAVSRVLHADDNGDGIGDRTVTVPMPIFHVLGLLSELGDRYWVLPGRIEGGHVVSGFASRDDRGVVRALLYTHDARDTQSRSGSSFDITLNIGGLGWDGPASVQEYRFDQDHNSPFRLARTLRDRPVSGPSTDPAALAAVRRALEGTNRDAQRETLATMFKLDTAARQTLVPTILKLAGQEQDQVIRAAAQKALASFFAPAAYSRAEIEQIQTMCEYHSTEPTTRPRQPDGRIKLTIRLAGNGCTFLRIAPDALQ
jgi:Glycosyl hydrolases family 39